MIIISISDIDRFLISFEGCFFFLIWAYILHKCVIVTTSLLFFNIENGLFPKVYTPNTGGGGSNSLDCTCNCNSGDTHSTLADDEVEIVLSEIRKNLTVFKANLSSSIRKRISATDPRMSSRVIGMTLGVSILSFVASLLVIPDLVAGFRCLMSRL